MDLAPMLRDQDFLPRRLGTFIPFSPHPHKEVERRRFLCKWLNVTFGLRNIAVLVLRYKRAAKRRLDLTW